MQYSITVTNSLYFNSTRFNDMNYDLKFIQPNKKKYVNKCLYSMLF